MWFNPVVARQFLAHGRGFGRFVLLALFAAVPLSGLLVAPAAVADDGDGAIPLFAATGTSPKLADAVPADLDLTLPQEAPIKASRASKPYKSEPIEETALFINGEFVAPPLVVSSEDDHVLVNGTEFPIDKVVMQSMRDLGYLEGNGGGSADEFMLYEDADSGMDERPRFRNRRRDSNGDESRRGRSRNNADDESDSGSRNSRAASGLSVPRIARGIANMLEGRRTIFVVFSERPVMDLPLTDGGLELLASLQADGDRQEFVDFVLKRLPADVDTTVWTDWLHSFQPSTEFNDFATQTIEFFNEVDARNTRDSSAVSRLRNMSYPMSIIGLLLSVFAFGHVVANKPPNRFTPVAEELTLETRQMVNRSLLLVVALSILDLIWTILASQAQQMTELNPLGREFIHNPAMLGAFKFLMTGLGVGLLFALKRHRIAQTAAWWACMILTLLTMRWLTFNSMFA